MTSSLAFLLYPLNHWYVKIRPQAVVIPSISLDCCVLKLEVSPLQIKGSERVLDLWFVSYHEGHHQSDLLVIACYHLQSCCHSFKRDVEKRRVKQDHLKFVVEVERFLYVPVLEAWQVLESCVYIETGNIIAQLLIEGLR